MCWTGNHKGNVAMQNQIDAPSVRPNTPVLPPADLENELRRLAQAEVSPKARAAQACIAQDVDAAVDGIQKAIERARNEFEALEKEAADLIKGLRMKSREFEIRVGQWSKHTQNLALAVREASNTVATFATEGGS